METLLLNQEEVLSLISMQEVIEAVEEGYRDFNQGKVEQPPIMSISVPKAHGEIDFKACYSASTDIISMKAASGYYDNMKNFGLPTGMGTVLLFDGKTGALICAMAGSPITGFRTGAAGAISAKHLARKDAKNVGIVGCGNQARMQIRALSLVRSIENVYAWDQYVEGLPAYKADLEKELGIVVHPCGSPEEAVRGRDIVITTTPSNQPIIHKNWIAEGVHVTAVGADMEGKQELDPAIFKGAKIVVDSIAQCTIRGETQNPLREGVITENDIYGEIGELVLGKKQGRTSDSEITIFDTTGMAIQDNRMACRIYEKALKDKIGTFFTFA